MSTISSNDKLKIAQHAAACVEQGASVILGAGIPTQCLKFLNNKDCWVIYETGVIGAHACSRDKASLIDASRAKIGLRDGGSIFDSTFIFSLIRSGRIQNAILGALEVDRRGNVACHATHSRFWGFGGALDIYSYVGRKIFTVPHDRFVDKLSIPVSAKRVADIVVTEKGAYEIK